MSPISELFCHGGWGRPINELIFCIVFILLASNVSAGEREVVDVRGVPLPLKQYKRIVSLAPSITEILFFVGAGDRVMGVSKFSNYPEHARSLPQVGGMFDPDVEKIMTLGPDLVVATRDGNPKRVITFLEKTGIPCFVIEPQTLEKILQAIEKIALLVGPRSSPMERIKSLKAGYRGIKPPGTGTSPRVLFLVSPYPLMGAGKGTFIDEIIRYAGGENVLSSSVVEYPHLQVEDIVSYAPDLIFYVTRMGFLGGEGLLKKIESILGDGRSRFIPLDPDIYTRPGPRLFKGLMEMRGYIGGGSK